MEYFAELKRYFLPLLFIFVVGDKMLAALPLRYLGFGVQIGKTIYRFLAKQILLTF
jgi:hypothetical protein